MRAFCGWHDLVVESAGYRRSFVGRAYLPAEVPAVVELQGHRWKLRSGNKIAAQPDSGIF